CRPRGAWHSGRSPEMADGTRSRLCARVGALLGICVVAGGCQTLLPDLGNAPTVTPAQVRAASDLAAPVADEITQVAWRPQVLTPRTVLDWAIDSGPAQSQRILSGRSQVGPDGTLILGPYGSVRVAGLTLAQAQAAMESQLAAYLRNPRVTLRIPALPAANTPAVQQAAAVVTPEEVQQTPPVRLPSAPQLQPAQRATYSPGNASTWRPVQHIGQGQPLVLPRGESETIARAAAPVSPGGLFNSLLKRPDAPSVLRVQATETGPAPKQVPKTKDNGAAANGIALPAPNALHL